MPGPGGGMRGGPGRGFLTDEEKANKPKVTWPLIKRILSYLKPYWKQMAIVLLCIIVSSVLGLLPSVLTGRIIDEGLIGRNMKMLITLILVSLGVTLGSHLIGVGESYLNNWIAQHISFDMRN
ncbi:MAG: ABC transporter ATP-binding protein, partial [Clostridia bacterium]|nr:ABC transporter ATP-binding protein [Clostridia bacterium]